MRLFVALPISSQLRERLALFLGELRRADAKPRWAHPENLHLTLKFIGQIADERLHDIAGALVKVAPRPQMALEIRGIGFFPNQRQPAVVWAGIEAPPELALLAAQIDEALAPCGVARETRPFLPHLTLARLKEPRLSGPLRALVANSRDRRFGEQMATEFQLMESKTKSTGAQYTTLHSFPFRAEGTPQ
jgi:RNA 2',3'-cyclic 3'-phosphodiesterase